MNSPLDLKRLYDADALPYPFIVKDKFVLLDTFNVEESYASKDHQLEDDGESETAKPGEKSTRFKGLVVGTPDYGSAKTIRAKVVGIPNYARGHFANGFALGDIVMTHDLVNNKLYLAGRQFQYMRAEDIVGWYELGPNAPITAENVAELMKVPA